MVTQNRTATEANTLLCSLVAHSLHTRWTAFFDFLLFCFCVLFLLPLFPREQRVSSLVKELHRSDGRRVGVSVARRGGWRRGCFGLSRFDPTHSLAALQEYLALPAEDVATSNEWGELIRPLVQTVTRMTPPREIDEKALRFAGASDSEERPSAEPLNLETSNRCALLSTRTNLSNCGTH